jgi:hypothetical protein
MCLEHECNRMLKITSSHATIVGPFHNGKGVFAFMASSSSSCLKQILKKKTSWACSTTINATAILLKIHVESDKPLQQVRNRIDLSSQL